MFLPYFESHANCFKDWKITARSKKWASMLHHWNLCLGHFSIHTSKAMQYWSAFQPTWYAVCSRCSMRRHDSSTICDHTITSLMRWRHCNGCASQNACSTKSLSKCLKIACQDNHITVSVILHAKIVYGSFNMGYFQGHCFFWNFQQSFPWFIHHGK